MDPFAHLDPEFERRTRPLRIGLTVVGTLLLIPGGAILYGFAMAWAQGLFSRSYSYSGAGTLVLVAALAAASGVLAWTSLCLLFFRAADLRWHRISWGCCIAYGVIGVPGMGLIFLWAASQAAFSSSGDWGALAFLIFAIAFGSALTALGQGIRLSREADERLKRRSQPARHGDA